MEKVIQVVIGSTSEHKINAIENAFAKVIPALSNIQCIQVNSDINKQPIGLEQTYQGALNRIQNVKVNLIDSWDYILGIENGIFEMHGQYYDFAWVVVESYQGKFSSAISTSVMVPKKDVLDAQKVGFDNVTVSEFTTKRLKGEKTDPHKTLTHSFLSRYEILEMAVISAISQIIFLN